MGRGGRSACGTGIGQGRGLDARRCRVRARMYRGFCRNVRENESRCMCGRKGKDVLCCIGAKPISRILRSQHMPVLYPWRSCWIKRRRRDVAQFWHFRPVVRHDEQRPVHSYDILQHSVPYKHPRQRHPSLAPRWSNNITVTHQVYALVPSFAARPSPTAQTGLSLSRLCSSSPRRGRARLVSPSPLSAQSCTPSRRARYPSAQGVPAGHPTPRPRATPSFRR